MSEPKFSVGKRVAVTAMPFQSDAQGRPVVVISDTTIAEIRRGYKPTAWIYGVADCPLYLYEEWQIMPIPDPDTDHATTTELERAS